MKTISNWHDLRPYGVDLLTGEACAFGMRYLCDVSERGAKIVRDLFGLPPGTPLSENWNSGQGNPTGRSVGSVMLPNECFGQLAVFCLFDAGATTVVVRTDGLIEAWLPGDEEDEEAIRYMDHLRRFKKIARSYRTPSGPSVGSRMEHQFTGRVA